MSYPINNEMIPVSVNTLEIIENGKRCLTMSYMNFITGERHSGVSPIDESAVMLAEQDMLSSLEDSILARDKRCLLIISTESAYRRVRHDLPFLRSVMGGRYLIIDALQDLQTFRDQHTSEAPPLFFNNNIIMQTCEKHISNRAGQLCMYDCMRFSEMVDYVPEWSDRYFQAVMDYEEC